MSSRVKPPERESAATEVLPRQCINLTHRCPSHVPGSSLAVKPNFMKGGHCVQPGATALQSATTYFGLGVMYEIGEGVSIDWNEAARYYKLSADLGCA